MSQSIDGAYVGPRTNVIFAGQVIIGLTSSKATISSIDRYAGMTIGSATISFPSRYAIDIEADMGKEARIDIGGTTVFRGVVGDSQADIDGGHDQFEMIQFDDKWQLESAIIGEKGRGTQPPSPPEPLAEVGDLGFAVVGFDITFNKHGLPNKKAGTGDANRDFDKTTAAIFWTLGDVMLFIFQYYVDSDIATLEFNDIDKPSYGRVPSHLNLFGQSALQAIDTVATLAGESWGLQPTASGSVFVVVANGAGTIKRIKGFKPKIFKTALQAGLDHYQKIRVGKSIRKSKDVIQVQSANIVKETVYTNIGDDPLLIEDAVAGASTYVDKNFKKRFRVDVTKYEDNSLGRSYPDGSKPKRWLKDLVTRRKNTTEYLTAADIAANEALIDATKIAVPLWVSEDGTEANARLVIGGARIDLRNGTVELKEQLDVKPSIVTTLVGKDTIDIKGKTIGVWLTVATVLEERQFAVTLETSNFLPRQFCQLIVKRDLVPQKRENTFLPDLTSGNGNAIAKPAATEEDYVDITDKLEVARDNAQGANAQIETNLRADFELMPIYNIGDNIRLSGRDLDTPNDMVCTHVRYEPHPSGKTSIEVTNVNASIDPEDFI